MQAVMQAAPWEVLMVAPGAATRVAIQALDTTEVTRVQGKTEATLVAMRVVTKEKDMTEATRVLGTTGVTRVVTRVAMKVMDTMEV